MRRLRRQVSVSLLALLICALTACTSTAQPAIPSDMLSLTTAPTTAPVTTTAPSRAQRPSTGADCPKTLHCIVKKASLASTSTLGGGTCSYSPLGKGKKQWHASGIVEHTTEGGSAASAFTQFAKCLSWNYLVDKDGTIYENVPLGNISYAADNLFFNADYIQVENVGYAEKCDITSAQYKASATLAKYLAHRYGFGVSPSTVIGHDSVPITSDATQKTQPQHVDPGTCWNWAGFLKQAGARAPVTASGSQVAEITAAGKTNDVALYTAPRTTAALLNDPYINGATTAQNDWSDKAVYGHRYVVIKHQGPWTEIWYGGQRAWFKGSSRPVAARTITPKHSGVSVYGRPLPTTAEFRAAGIPASVTKSQDTSARLTKYRMDPGQSYVLVSSSVRNRFFEGCDKTDCSGQIDGIVVNGKDKYLEIDWNHRYVFVKASDVTIHGG